MCLSRRTAVSVRHKPSYARMQLLRVAWALTGAAICCFLILLIHSRLLKEGNRSELHLITCHFYALLMRHRLPCSLCEVFRNSNSNADCVRRFGAIAIKYRLFLLVAGKSKSKKHWSRLVCMTHRWYRLATTMLTGNFPYQQVGRC